MMIQGQGAAEMFNGITVLWPVSAGIMVCLGSDNPYYGVAATFTLWIFVAIGKEIVNAIKAGK